MCSTSHESNNINSNHRQLNDSVSRSFKMDFKAFRSWSFITFYNTFQSEGAEQPNIPLPNHCSNILYRQHYKSPLTATNTVITLLSNCRKTSQSVLQPVDVALAQAKLCSRMTSEMSGENQQLSCLFTIWVKPIMKKSHRASTASTRLCSN